ncbi:Transmembrane protein [Trichinella pseudospiralis]|uniref:Transmembrane protein n=1 Tax=Trichinella pseudospiralis TaxID=6337 RepID=A0A0V1E5S1_TRIPS|nr:Transmembrane protein [Trichinella pseudospiralis]
MKCKFCPDHRSFEQVQNRRPRGNERQYIIGIVGRGNGDELDVDKYVSRLSWHVELQSNTSISVSFLFAVYFIYSRANFPICSSIDLQKLTQATFASYFFIVQSIFPSSFISMLRLKFSILDLLNCSVFQNYNQSSRLIRQEGSKSRSTKTMPIFSMVGGSKLCRVNNGKPETRRIPAVLRFYIYALHGLATEIVFTALFEIVINGGNRKLHGLTSIWAAFIYGFTMLTGELLARSLFTARTRIFLPNLGLHLGIQASSAYFSLSFFFENKIQIFSTGLLLRQFDACPWDYGHYPGQFMGLITVVYAPFWYVAGLLTEILLIRRALNVPKSSSVFVECSLKND